MKNGKIYDLRRLCNDFTFFAPRKTDKTGLSAFIQVVFFLLEDSNSEAYCCANSADQSKLLFSRTTQMLRQLDDGHRLRLTQTVADWRPQFQSVRHSSIRPLSAGGKTKDGMFAQLCCADEYGAAPYTNGRSDMKLLVDVISSSMGPRREPLVFTTTTAGRIHAGPFMEKLDSLHSLLMKELEYDEDPSACDLASDRTLCILYEPDDWEKNDEELLLTSKTIRRKVNPMLGKIVQHQFYDDGAAKARLEGDTGEFISKYINVYQSATTRDWLSAEDIRALQVDRRIDDCLDSRGWIVFVGCDFSRGDDLNGVSYLAYNVQTGRFFADMDSWMSEKAVNESPIRELLLKWNAEGWLHIVPGQTFDPSWPVNRIIELDKKGVNFIAFLYDPYNAKVVVNALGQWVFEIGLDPKQLIRPVRQNFATYNPAVAEFDFMVKRSRDDGFGHQIPDPMVRFSPNPMWPWEFGNVTLQESNDGMENVKPVKRDGGAACKVDNVQMLLSALIGYDQADATVNK
jgi:phage terminase large subunit-like protein